MPVRLALCTGTARALLNKHCVTARRNLAMRQIGKCQMRETCDREQHENATNSIEGINRAFLIERALRGANSVQIQISEEDCT